VRLTVAVTAVALLAGFATTAAAQGQTPVRWPRPTYAMPPWPAATQAKLLSAPFVFAPAAASVDSTRIAPTHWRTGAIIGGTVLGLLSAAAFVGMCGYDSPCHRPLLYALGGFALGGLTGFGIGALIGGQFPARAP
jgi:hypothetical protein